MTISEESANLSPNEINTLGVIALAKEVKKENIEQKIVGEEFGADTRQTTAEVSHEITLFAEPIIHVGGFTITNSLLTAWIAVLIIAALAFLIRRKIAQIPRGWQNLMEIVIDGALGLIDSVTNDRRKSLRLFPIVFAIFIFILVNNWMGLLPGIGSIGFIEELAGHRAFIPLFRGGTADLNTTLALALFAIITTHVLGMISSGVWRHFNKFVSINLLLEIPKKILKEPTIVLVNPIKFFVGLIEIVSEASKVASLSFRLFGNIFAGEVLLTSIATILAFGAPVPFMFLELIVGIVQALVFSMLTLVFATIATSEAH